MFKYFNVRQFIKELLDRTSTVGKPKLIKNTINNKQILKLG